MTSNMVDWKAHPAEMVMPFLHLILKARVLDCWGSTNLWNCDFFSFWGQCHWALTHSKIEWLNYILGVQLLTQLRNMLFLVMHSQVPGTKCRALWNSITYAYKWPCKTTEQVYWHYIIDASLFHLVRLLDFKCHLFCWYHFAPFL